MKKIVLHIGSGKTGSSSIQRALFDCVSGGEAGFSFPTLLGSKSNQTFRFGFCDRNETTINVRQRFSQDVENIEFKAYQEEIQNSFKSQIVNSETVIVSSEFLFLSSKEEVNKINQFLKVLGFSEIHIIVYLRDPASYYLSVAQQALKNQHNMPSPDGFRLDMCSAITNWTSISPTSMTIKEFDKSRLENQNVVSDFQTYLSDIGIKSVLDGRKVSNKTLSAEATQVLQDYHLTAQGAQKTAQEKQDHLSRARIFIRNSPDGTRPALKQNISAHIYRRFESELLQMHADHGVFDNLVNNLTKVSQIPQEQNYEVNTFRDIVVDFDLETYRYVSTQI